MDKVKPLICATFRTAPSVFSPIFVLWLKLGRRLKNAERERERERERETERDRERQRETETETERQRDRDRQTDRQT